MNSDYNEQTKRWLCRRPQTGSQASWLWSSGSYHYKHDQIQTINLDLSVQRGNLPAKGPWHKGCNAVAGQIPENDQSGNL